MVLHLVRIFFLIAVLAITISFAVALVEPSDSPEAVKPVSEDYITVYVLIPALAAAMLIKSPMALLRSALESPPKPWSISTCNPCPSESVAPAVNSNATLAPTRRSLYCLSSFSTGNRAGSPSFAREDIRAVNSGLRIGA